MRPSKHKRQPSARKLSPFERETERRRREMKAHLAGRVSPLPVKLLKTFIATPATAVITRDATGRVISTRLPHSNPFRKLARPESAGRKYLYGQKGREVYA